VIVLCSKRDRPFKSGDRPVIKLNTRGLPLIFRACLFVKEGDGIKMTEEEKKEQKQEKPEEPKQEEAQAEEKPQEAPKPQEPKAEKEEPKSEEKPAAPAKSAAPAGEAAKGKKRKKIRTMNLKELEQKLKDVKDKMGSLKSRYAKGLLKQKSVLSGDQPQAEDNKKKTG